MEHSENPITTYTPKGAFYYYLGSLLATLAVLLFMSLLILTSFMDNESGLIIIASIYAVIILITPFVAIRFFKRKNQLARLDYINQAVLRIATFLIMMTYASAKLMNGQLNVFYYALDTKLNDLDDIFMVWAFYGKSSFLQVMLGLMELIPAILLLFRRTTFVGAILMLPVNANIFMINSLYKVSPFTFVESGLLLLFNLYLVYFYKNEIAAVLKKTWHQPEAFVRKPFASRLVTSGKLVVLGLIALMLVRTIYNSKSGKLKKAHPVTGGYELVNLVLDNVPVDLSSKQLPYYKKLYFERSWVSGFADAGNNTIYNIHAVFWSRDSISITNNIGSWDNFIPEKSSVFKGVYKQPNDSTLILNGRQGNRYIEANYKKLRLRNYDYWW